MPVPFPPIEPPPARVRFPDPARSRSPEVVAIGCDFNPGTLVLAYRSGIFPWPHGDDQQDGAPLVLWFSPDPRCIFPLEGELHWSRSLRRTLRIHPYEVTLDEDFEQVIHMCGATRAKNTWIIPELVDGYRELHRLGWAHSVEVWEKPASPSGQRTLVGGIYGVSIGGAFAGESMFHHETDASKAALVALIGLLDDHPDTLVDCQWLTPHLASLGAVAIPRHEYLERLQRALARPLPEGLLRAVRRD